MLKDEIMQSFSEKYLYSFQVPSESNAFDMGAIKKSYKCLGWQPI